MHLYKNIFADIYVCTWKYNTDKIENEQSSQSVYISLSQNVSLYINLKSKCAALIISLYLFILCWLYLSSGISAIGFGTASLIVLFNSRIAFNSTFMKTAMIRESRVSDRTIYIVCLAHESLCTTVFVRLGNGNT